MHKGLSGICNYTKKKTTHLMWFSRYGRYSRSEKDGNPFFDTPWNHTVYTHTISQVTAGQTQKCPCFRKSNSVQMHDLDLLTQYYHLCTNTMPMLNLEPIRCRKGETNYNQPMHWYSSYFICLSIKRNLYWFSLVTYCL